MKSCLYTGTIAHRRHGPKLNRFSYGLFQLYLDLDELDCVFRGRWLWSVRRFAVARFRRDDHLGDPSVPLKESVRALLSERGLTLDGPVRLLTQLRLFGYLSNPVSFYFCFAADGVSLRHVIAEVTNTPWGERHCYVMSGARRTGPSHSFAFDKTFHVSPFLPMDLRYEWRFSEPGQALRIHNNSYRAGVKVFDATLTLEREPVTGRSLARALLRRPLMSFKVTALIYAQAAVLWCKRVPFFTHPRKRAPVEPPAPRESITHE